MVSKLRGRCRYGPFPPDHSPQWLLPQRSQRDRARSNLPNILSNRHPMLLPSTGQPRRGRPERPASAAPTSYSERDDRDATCYSSSRQRQTSYKAISVTSRTTAAAPLRHCCATTTAVTMVMPEIASFAQFIPLLRGFSCVAAPATIRLRTRKPLGRRSSPLAEQTSRTADNGGPRTASRPSRWER